MADPQRRETRRTHLDASVVPVERALIARADSLDEQAHELHASAQARVDIDQQTAEEVTELVGRRRLLAKEFRALAEELHFW
jgi:hypothetical protein